METLLFKVLHTLSQQQPHIDDRINVDDYKYCGKVDEILLGIKAGDAHIFVHKKTFNPISLLESDKGFHIQSKSLARYHYEK